MALRYLTHVDYEMQLMTRRVTRMTAMTITNQIHNPWRESSVQQKLVLC